jgi:predicted nucleic acid-binding Zn ribbon protein
MTTYLYETIPQKSGAKPRHFEIKQSMNDQPLTRHPDTGEPIRRVLVGGFGVLSGASQPAKQPATRRTHCGPSCGCH